MKSSSDLQTTLNLSHRQKRVPFNFQCSATVAWRKLTSLYFWSVRTIKIDGTMAWGNKAQKQIMAAIYEGLDGRKLWPLQNSTQYMHFSKKKGDKRTFCEKVVRARKQKGVLEFVSTLSSWQNKVGKWHHYHGKQCCYEWQKGNRWTIQCALYSIADCVPLMKETDYGQHFQNHPSIIAIHEKNKATDAPLFNFEHINQAQVERALLDVNVRKSCGHDMLSQGLWRNRHLS